MKINKVRMVFILVVGTIIGGLILNSLGATGDLFSDLFIAFVVTFIGAWIVESIFQAGYQKSEQDQRRKAADERANTDENFYNW